MDGNGIGLFYLTDPCISWGTSDQSKVTPSFGFKSWPQGERLVGETINWLMKDGFDVFHDYPIDPNGKSGNIDHIVVGPNGVFAIETKAVRTNR